ncbi:hypothetical protein [Leptospira noguchii]|uniref:Putative lipoprotein n=1 Tax=Leptospira noguchii serovar Panama str. CZ214 TaxID=1001595 RepID=T0GL29_9LEPT|nr:hypothetical protein [Leptospira noguchii]EQA69587.1 putative lipoprotein [Leptospira noguchii serovar Panama str. CZ214]
MKIIPNNLFFSMVLVVLISCQKEGITLKDNDYLIFGFYAGECFENCVSIYKLSAKEIYKNYKEELPYENTFYNGEYKALHTSDFDLTKDLLLDFPLALLDENNSKIGDPDGHDQGGLYIEYSFGSERKFWLIDTSKEVVPIKYHKFIDKLGEKLRLLH